MTNRIERGLEGGEIHSGGVVTTRPPFRTFVDTTLTPAQLQWLYDATASRLHQFHDRWFDPAHFLKMLQDSVRQGDGYHGRAPVGKEKECFAMSELKVAYAHGQRHVTEMVRYLKYRFEFAVYPKRRVLKPFPIVLVVEPTSICNLRCVMCFIADPRLSQNPTLNGMMRLELFRRIIDEAAEHGLNSLVMASRGEPLLNKAFPEMLDYAKRRGILDIKINTNATRLTPELSRRILAADPDLVVFSVDTAEPEVYGQIRVGAKFDQVLHNIQTFAAIREQEFPKNRTITRATMVVLREEQRIEQSRDFWLHYVDEVGVNQVFERLNIYDRPEKDTAVPCSLLWERLYVWWDGTTNPCDMDYLSHLSPGKLEEGVTISSIWRGPQMRALRDKHLDGMKNRCDPCNRCNGF